MAATPKPRQEAYGATIASFIRCPQKSVAVYGMATLCHNCAETFPEINTVSLRDGLTYPLLKLQTTIWGQTIWK